jgi:hypothetical protein
MFGSVKRSSLLRKKKRKLRKKRHMTMVPVEESHKADDVESKAVEKPGVNVIKLFFLRH